MHLIEKECWDQLCEGSEEAFGKLYDMMSRDLFKYGYRISEDSERVQDSIQDLFLSLWKNRHTLSKVNSPRFYLFKSLRNRLIRIADHEKVFTSVDDILPDDWLQLQISSEEQWISEEEKQGQIKQLAQALLKLSARQQEFIQLRYFHDFSSEEIGRIMQINAQSVRNLHFRTLQQLRTEIPMHSLILVKLICDSEIV